jgi:hypothetical protein
MALAWSIDDYAALYAELEARSHDPADVWARRGVAADASICDAIHEAWRARLRDGDLRRQFEACLCRHRFILLPSR